MELKAFISNALLSIIDGVADANLSNNCFELSGSYHSGKAADGTKVDFDLSVVAEESHEQDSIKGGRLKIQILSAGINLQDKDTEKNKFVQNIKFSVFINEGKLEK